MKIVSIYLSKVSKLSLLAFVILSFVSAGFAQSGKITDVAAQASQVTEFEVNGLKVLLKRRPTSPTISVGLFIRGGARNISEKNAGIENLMLGTATEASKKYPREALRRELSRTGSSISSGANNDFSVISLASTRENFDRSWDIFTDVSINPAFAADDIERQRRQILTGLREEEISPDSFLQVLQDRVIYKNHPYANKVSGTPAIIGALTANDLKAYHQNLMQTSKLLLVVVGDLSEEDLKNRVTASFGKLPRGDYKETAYPTLDFSKATLDVFSRTLPTNYIQGIYNAPALNNPDFYAMRVATTILRDRVFEEVRNKRQLSYAPSADLNNFAANTANIYVTAVDANQAVSVMLKEVEKLKTEAVDTDDIDGVAGQFLTTYYIGQETNAAQAVELARYELIGGGWRNSFEFLNKIRAVKPADIQSVSQKYLKNVRFVVVGNPSAINKEVFVPAGQN